MANSPLINGVNYSWANVTMTIYGVPVVGITKIEYKKKQKKEPNYGMGQDPISYGYGNNEYEAKITLYTDEWRKIIAAAPNNDPLQAPFSDIIVSFGGSRVTAKTDVLQAAEFMEDPFTISQGETKSMVDLPIIIAGILHKVV
jgi:hypothetical protein